MIGFGGRVLSTDECKDVSRAAGQAHSNLSNINAIKDKAGWSGSISQKRQREALRSLAGHLYSTSNWNTPIKAIVTGRRSEIVVKSIGAVGNCESCMDKMVRGDEVDVLVSKIDPERGILIVRTIK